MSQLGAAKVPYSKQSNDFLIRVLKAKEPILKSLSDKLSDKKLPASQRSKLLAEQKRVILGFWNPAKANLTSRGYKVSVVNRKLVITPPGSAAPASVSPAEPTGKAPKSLVLAAIAAAGLYWYFVMRKQSPGISALQSA